MAVFAQFLRGLAAVHDAGVVHRDIKPGNLMLDRTGRVRLMDFGLARREGQERFTLAGSVIGTPEYMSPEQAQGRTADGRSDLYSAGVILYEMLSGRPPFKGKDTIAILRSHVEDTPPPLLDAASSLPEALVTVVHRLLEKSPDRRYAQVSELEAALSTWIPDARTSEAMVRDLVKAVGETASKPTVGATASWAVTPSPSASGSRAGEAVGNRLFTTIAVASAVIALMALALAIMAVLRKPVERPTRAPSSPMPVTQPAEGVWWRVTRRNGDPFAGRLVRTRRAKDGRLLFEFEDRQAKPVVVPSENLRKWRKEVIDND